MEFNEEEIKEIENTAALIPSIGKLYDWYRMCQEDAGQKFHQSLLLTIASLNAEVESVGNGSYKKLRILESDSKVWKRIYSLLKDSKKIREGLEQSRELISGGGEKNGRVKKEEADEEEISITDKMANLGNK